MLYNNLNKCKYDKYLFVLTNFLMYLKYFASLTRL